MMKNKEGIKRIYICISVLWIIFSLYNFYIEIPANTIADQLRELDGETFDPAYYWLMGSFIPLPLFFIISWVSKGFDK